MMQQNKYNLGQKLYFRLLPEEYQLDNVFVPKFIDTKTYKIKDDDGEIEVEYFIYSENGHSWYPENTLSDEIVLMNDSYNI